MAKQIGNIRITPNMTAPDLFVDDAVAIEDVNGTVRITLTVAKLDDGAAPSPMSLVVVGRLILGDESAQRLAVTLLNHFRGRGVDLLHPVGDRSERAN